MYMSENILNCLYKQVCSQVSVVTKPRSMFYSTIHVQVHSGESQQSDYDGVDLGNSIPKSGILD